MWAEQKQLMNIYFGQASRSDVADLAQLQHVTILHTHTHNTHDQSIDHHHTVASQRKRTSSTGEIAMANVVRRPHR